MSTILTAKGQVTIPKKIRDVLGLAPGTTVDFDLDQQGRIVICRAGEKPIRPNQSRDRFDRARGRATVKVLSCAILTRHTRRYRSYFPTVALLAPPKAEKGKP